MDARIKQFSVAKLWWQSTGAKGSCPAQMTDLD